MIIKYLYRHIFLDDTCTNIKITKQIFTPYIKQS